MLVVLIGVFAPLDGLHAPLAHELIFLDESLGYVLALAGEDVEDVEYAPDGAEEITNCCEHVNLLARDGSE